MLTLAGFAFLGVTMVLYVLARRYQIDTERHDLIRYARIWREDYQKRVEDRRETLQAMMRDQQANPMGVSSHARLTEPQLEEPQSEIETAPPLGSIGPADEPVAQAA